MPNLQPIQRWLLQRGRRRGPSGGRRVRGLAGRRGKITARRLVLAYGVRDTLPDLPGLAERWGVSVLHCPYCHGYELDRQPVGVLARNDMAFHQAMLLPDWGPTTLFTQGSFEPTSEQRQALVARGAELETTPVVSLLGPSPKLEAVHLTDGRTIPLAALFVAPLTLPSSDLANQLGCAMRDGPTGPYLEVDAMQATTVPGVFAAGDLASPMPNATLAAAAGCWRAPRRIARWCSIPTWHWRLKPIRNRRLRLVRACSHGPDGQFAPVIEDVIVHSCTREAGAERRIVIGTFGVEARTSGRVAQCLGANVCNLTACQRSNVQRPAWKRALPQPSFGL